MSAMKVSPIRMGMMTVSKYAPGSMESPFFLILVIDYLRDAFSSCFFETLISTAFHSLIKTS